MKQVLFVRPDSREGGKIMWCESGSERVEVVDSLEMLAEHPLATRVCLLLPASDMIFRHFTLPKKVASQAMAFSWMAEETLIGDVDNLHWTVLHKKGADVDAVAIDADRLRAALTRCQEAGLNVIQALPDAWLLPVTAGGSTLVAQDDGYWLRLSPHVAGEMEATLLPLLMQKAGVGEVWCYGDAPAKVHVDVQHAWQHPLALIQPQWQTCRVNLLHGEFSLKAGHGRAAKSMKAAMVAAGVLSVGKPLGISLFCWLALKLKLASLPNGTTFSQIMAVGVLCGIGFTMSIFISTLAFGANAPELIVWAKLGILIGSLLAAVIGYTLLKVKLSGQAVRA